MLSKVLCGVFSLVLIQSILSFAAPAIAAPDDEFQAAIQATGKQYLATLAKICRGGTDRDLPIVVGLANDRADDQRCQYIGAMLATCLDLARETGSIQNAVNNGYGTYADEADHLLNQTGSDSTLGLQALHLAETAPSTESSAQLMEETYSNCASYASPAQ